jgi:hypothetical protein
MPRVTSLNEEFIDQLFAAAGVSSAADDATMLNGQRQWMLPPSNGWNGDPQDIVGMNLAFKRDNLNAQYQSVLGTPEHKGTVGEAMVVKLQIDYVAALERAFRTRHCSSIRAKIHAAGRRRGQGDTSKGLWAGNVLWLERMLFAAHDDPYAGQEGD